MSNTETAARSAMGVPIGVCDRNGNPLHIGDTLKFDPREWGDDCCVFEIKLENGEIVHPGTTSDLSNWCDLVRRWDGTAIENGDLQQA